MSVLGFFNFSGVKWSHIENVDRSDLKKKNLANIIKEQP